MPREVRGGKRVFRTGIFEETAEAPRLPSGQFGENFTVRGFTEEQLHTGDIFRAGDARQNLAVPGLSPERRGEFETRLG